MPGTHTSLGMLSGNAKFECPLGAWNVQVFTDVQQERRFRMSARRLERTNRNRCAALVRVSLDFLFLDPRGKTAAVVFVLFSDGPLFKSPFLFLKFS